MNSRIAITGAKGIIGTVLQNSLNDHYEITSLDLPQTDIRDYDQVKAKLVNQKAIIHLAWETSRDNFRSENLDPDNLQMVFNVYKAAKEMGVKRVIMASSVHADRFDTWENSPLKSPDKIPTPDSPYGAMKVGMEALGRYFASQGLEVVCIRFGGVNKENLPAEEPIYERAVWLSHNDCVSLVDLILKAEKVPNNFTIVYGVSNNPGRIHDISNPFNWMPQDTAPRK